MWSLSHSEAALITDSITLLTSKGPRATKVFTWSPELNAPHIQDYGLAKLFSIQELPVWDIYELAAVIDSIATQTKTFIVCGRPVSGIDRQNCARRHHKRTNKDGTVELATLESVAHYWLPLDIDSLLCPDNINPVNDVEEVIRYVVSMLPLEFRDTTVFYQFTSSAGIKPGIRVRLYFWSEVPLYDWQLKMWLANYPVDLAIFTPSQPIYSANPIFIGMKDPVPRRSGLIIGKKEVITPPTIGELDLLSRSDDYNTTRHKADISTVVKQVKPTEVDQLELFSDLPTCSVSTKRRRSR